MLKVLRDNIKYLSWVLWAVIAVFVLFVFVDFGTVVPGGMGGGREAAATVGDKTVTFDEYRRSYENLEQQYRQAFGEQFSRELADQLGLPQRALETVVNRKVLLVEAERQGLVASDEEVRREILELPVFLDADGKFVGAEQYEQMLARMRYSVPQFEAAIREDLLLGKLSDALAQSVYIPDQRVDEAYREQVERAAIRFVQLPAASLTEEGRASRAELAAYLDEHREEFRLPEQRRVAYLLADNARLRGSVEVPDEDVQAYYDGHQEEFTIEDQVQARHILLAVNEDRTLEQARQELAALRARIEGGEAFAAVAAEASEDSGSAARGGNLGYFGRGRMTPEFEQAAFDAPVGELVGPVETPFGVHLLEVTDRREAGVQPLDQVAPRIRSRLLNERVQAVARERAAAAAENLAGEETITVARLQELADGDDALEVEEPGPFGQDDMIPGVGRAADFTAAAFSQAPGELSEPVQVPRGYALVLVTEVLEPRDPALDEVEARVRVGAEQEKRQQLAMQRLAAAREDVAEGRKSLDQVADELSLDVTDSGEFGGGGSIEGLGFQPRIAEAALSMQQGEVGGPYGTDQGAVIFEVTSRTTADPAEIETNREATREQLAQQELQRLLAALIEQRKLELGVSYDNRLVEELGLGAVPRDA